MGTTTSKSLLSTQKDFSTNLLLQAFKNEELYVINKFTQLFNCSEIFNAFYSNYGISVFHAGVIYGSNYRKENIKTLCELLTIFSDKCNHISYPITFNKYLQIINNENYINISISGIDPDLKSDEAKIIKIDGIEPYILAIAILMELDKNTIQRENIKNIINILQSITEKSINCNLMQITTNFNIPESNESYNIVVPTAPTINDLCVNCNMKSEEKLVCKSCSNVLGEQCTVLISEPTKLIS